MYIAGVLGIRLIAVLGVVSPLQKKIASTELTAANHMSRFQGAVEIHLQHGLQELCLVAFIDSIFAGSLFCLPRNMAQYDRVSVDVEACARERIGNQLITARIFQELLQGSNIAVAVHIFHI